MIDNTKAIIFNRAIDHSTGETLYYKTAIPAVHWEESVVSDQDKTSNEKHCNSFVSISFTVLSKMKKKYVKPEAFAKLADKERQRRWTIATGDILVKASACEEIPARGLRKWMAEHPEATVVTRVDTFDFCLMKHWEVHTE